MIRRYKIWKLGLITYTDSENLYFENIDAFYNSLAIRSKFIYYKDEIIGLVNLENEFMIIPFSTSNINLDDTIREAIIGYKYNINSINSMIIK